MGVQVSTANSIKMNPRSPLFFALVVLAMMAQMPRTDSTFAIAVTSAAGASILSLTAAQVTGIAALGVLVKAQALLAGKKQRQEVCREWHHPQPGGSGGV